MSGDQRRSVAKPHEINDSAGVFGRIDNGKTPASAATDRGRGRTYLGDST